ncbi:MAG: phosphate-starvation-inducible PsiE family protein [Bacteroidales bacterium]|nr:phosphate-starvation-inducible PsiE family protein [Bacteroidales bacterium]
MAEKDLNNSKLNKFTKRVERYIIKTLIAFMSILLIIATLQLGYEVIIAIITSNGFLIDMDGLMGLFGVFLLVLIGIELLDTIKVYFREHVIHVEVVMLVAIIAVARKVIVMDFDKYSGLEVIGIAAIILALAGGYFLIKKTGGCGFWPSEKEENRETVVEETTLDEETGNKVLERKKTIKSQISETPTRGSAIERQSLGQPISPKREQKSDRGEFTGD